MKHNCKAKALINQKTNVLQKKYKTEERFIFSSLLSA